MKELIEVDSPMLIPKVLYADFFYYYARSKWYGGK